MLVYTWESAVGSDDSVVVLQAIDINDHPFSLSSIPLLVVVVVCRVSR